MPFRFQKSAAHKVACCSLYRALLKQCNRFSQPAISKNLKNLVRYRFEKDRTLQSPVQVINGLILGREALGLLQNASSGSHTAMQQLTQTVSAVTERFSSIAALRNHRASLRRPTRPSKLKKVAHLQALSNKLNHQRRPETVPVLERPVPFDQLPGDIRVIPKLVVTDSIPFLRYSKRPPLPLVRAIRNRKRKTAKRWDQRIALEKSIMLGDWEDEWEHRMQKQSDEAESVLNGGDETGSETSQSWSNASKSADKELLNKIWEEDRYLVDMAEKMWNVSVAEREMAKKERAERKEQQRANKHGSWIE